MASVANAAEQTRGILSSFICELDVSLGGELFIVLNAFHTINDSPQILEVMNSLLDHMLPEMHFYAPASCPAGNPAPR